MRFFEQMKARSCFLLALVLLMTAMIPTALAADYPYNGVINADTNMRSAPKSNVSNVIRRLIKGESVVVMGATGNFYRIEFDGRTGYVFKKYVDKGSAATPAPTSVPGSAENAVPGQGLYKTVTTDAVNMRSSASATGRKILTIPNGATVTVNAIREDWVNVTYAGRTGWCHSAYIHLLNLPQTSAVPTMSPVENTSSYQVLQSGADGTQVTALQEALIELGYLRTAADGVYGSATAQAVMALQRVNDYPITGIADANLQAFIFNGKPVDSTGNKVSIKTLPAISGLNVRYGDQGVLVRTIQSRLEALGLLSSNVTGTYDRATESAVKTFQGKNGLTADGVCGPDTQDRLFDETGAQATPAPQATPTPLPTFEIPKDTVRSGSKGNDARLVQERLIELGYMNGAADGVFGAKSVAALKAFQTKNGLTADGVAGSGTFEVLFSHVALGVGYVPLATPTPEPDATPAPTYPAVTQDNVVVIRQGVKGNMVAHLQRRLVELGYYETTADGICGADDAAAIRAFQRKNGLDVDGVAGYATQSLLYSGTAIRDDGLMAGAVQETYTTLKKGMSGAAVMQLQQRLIQLGYMSGAADGVYGTDTAEAVYYFQKNNGLVRDGVAGEKTLKAVYSANAVQASPAPQTTPGLPSAGIESALIRLGDTGAMVTALQEKLIRLGYLSGKADGVFGERTYRALKNFQKANALYADGIAGANTIAALNIAGTLNNGAAGNIGGSTAPSVTTAPDASTNLGTTVPVNARNVVYEYWYSTVRAACRKYPYATVYDYQTGISWQVHMFSYGKHAEAEPLTAADTHKMEEACGGNVWTPRPVWVIFADGTIRMATTHSVPHEVEHIRDNDFPGHTCIHFPRTMAQVTAIGPYATSHQKAVDKAWAEVQTMIR